MAADYRSDVQGLRAVAVLGVITYHVSGGEWVTGGFAGVDVFFVISGFLITGTLLRAHREGRWSLTDFYRRRCRRILPAALVMIATVLIAGLLVLAPEHYRSTARGALASLFFVSNQDLGLEVGYFAPSADLKPLIHTWSLSVEEQFYLLFPLGLGILLLRARRSAFAMVALGTLVSFGISVWASEARPAFAFNAMPSRAFELGAGALLAFRPEVTARWPLVWRKTLGAVGLTVIILSLMFFTASTQWPGLPALAPTLGTAAVIAAGQAGPAGRLLRSPPLTVIGTISYSLYLWHWPLLVLAHHWLLAPLAPEQTAMVVTATFVVGWASWRWIEKPFLGAPRRGTLWASAVATATVAGAAWLVMSSEGASWRFGAEAREAFASRADYNPRRPDCHRGEERWTYDRTCTYGPDDAPASVAVWGDSLGAELAMVLSEELGSRRRSVRQITSSSCPPTLRSLEMVAPGCAAHNRVMLDGILSDRHITSVVLTAHYTRHGNQSAVAEAVTEIALKLSAAGKTVVVIAAQPMQPFSPPEAIAMRLFRGQDPSAWGISRAEHLADTAASRATLWTSLAKSPVQIVDPSASLCDLGRCRAWTPSEGVLFFDATHLSVPGARRLAPAVLERLNDEVLEPTAKNNAAAETASASALARTMNSAIAAGVRP